ncbi:MAG: DUF4197 domain-containing protein [Chromatiales bacterium]|nr:DUF4197 domain-containing protein [Chromatiales bacterium]
MRALVSTTVVAAALGPTTAAAQLGNLLDKLKVPGLGQGTGAAAAGALTDSEVVSGLKEALAQGAERAVSELGRGDGFLGNPSVRIPIPESLRPVEKALRTFGQGRYADELVTTMNRAAEGAVPQAGPILGDAIREMTVEDAQRILSGPDDAATQYFRKVGDKRLTAALRPLVEQATSRAGVTAAYKGAIGKAGPAAGLLAQQAPDLDGYVTDKALDGLFAMIAAEEKRIRSNPLARGTDLLKKVFGAAR